VLNKQDNGLIYRGVSSKKNRTWKGSISCISFDPAGIKDQLLEIDKPCYIVKVGVRIGVKHYVIIPLDNRKTTEIQLPIILPTVFF